MLSNLVATPILAIGDFKRGQSDLQWADIISYIPDIEAVLQKKNVKYLTHKFYIFQND